MLSAILAICPSKTILSKVVSDGIRSVRMPQWGGKKQTGKARLDIQSNFFGVSLKEMQIAAWIIGLFE
jgi:hypothetical protein